MDANTLKSLAATLPTSRVAGVTGPPGRRRAGVPRPRWSRIDLSFDSKMPTRRHQRQSDCHLLRGIFLAIPTAVLVRTKIIAKSDRSVFVGTETDGGFCVLSLDDSVDIELGDVLRGTFDDSDGLFKDVYNETQQETVHICVENWGCSQQVAFGFIHRLNRPTKIWTL